MVGLPCDPLSGLPDLLRQLLAQPPVREKKLLELRAEWPALPRGRARMADALRLFVITWDPLELLAPRPVASAAVNTNPLELAVYLPCWSLAELAAEQGKTATAVLGAVAGAAVMTGAAHHDVLISGRYPFTWPGKARYRTWSGIRWPVMCLARPPYGGCRHDGKISGSAPSLTSSSMPLARLTSIARRSSSGRPARALAAPPVPDSGSTSRPSWPRPGGGDVPGPPGRG